MSILLQLNEAISKAEQKRLMKEWREISGELAIFSAIAKKMASRVSEIESALVPIVKEADGQKEVIDNAILEYSQSKGKKSVSYSDLWSEALKAVSEDQKAVLEAYKETISKVGAGSESLKIIDPKLQKTLAGLKKDMTVEELKMLLKEIVKLPENDLQEASIIARVREAIKMVIEAFKPVQMLQNKAKKSANALLTLSKQEIV